MLKLCVTITKHIRGTDTNNLAAAVTFGGLSLAVEICCVCVTVVFGNREKYSHYIQLKVPSSTVCLGPNSVGRLVHSCLGNWPLCQTGLPCVGPLGLTGLTSMREREGEEERGSWRTCFTMVSECMCCVDHKPLHNTHSIFSYLINHGHIIYNINLKPAGSLHLKLTVVDWRMKTCH